MRVPKILHYILVLALICTLYVPQTFAATEVKIKASDGAAGDMFGDGQSVGIDGNYSIVGAQNNDDNGSNSGSAYIFYKSSVFSWVEQKKLLPSDGAETDLFGASVAISGDYAIVGAYQDGDLGGNSGSAYIFYKDQGGASNWGQIKKLTASDGAEGDYFGLSVSINGDYAIVGAFSESSVAPQSGAAYIFYKDQGGAGNWGQVKKIKASDAADGDFFGYSVSINGNYAIAGGYGDDDNGDSSGSAYIFYKDQGGAGNWGQVTKLLASDGAEFDYFGSSVSISGTNALIGGVYNDDLGNNSGSAYIFNKDQGGSGNWGQVKKLLASDGTGYDHFGHSVSINGDYLAVGAYDDDDNGDSSGSAYIFHKDEGGAGNWGEYDKYTASDGAVDDYFGYSVGIDGNYFIAGAYGDDDNGSESGSAYIYDHITMSACGGVMDPNDGDLCIVGEVSSGVAITAGDDVELTVDPANGVPTDNSGTNTLTVWNNNEDGFNVTVVLVGDDNFKGKPGTSDTLGVDGTLITLADEGGTIKFMSTENAGAGDATLSGGTDVDSFTVYSGATSVYSNNNTTDGVCTGGTITVGHELYANTDVMPATYSGTATYTIAVGV